jgi:hypothetical protein
MKNLLFSFFLCILSANLTFSQCDFFENVSVRTSGFNATASFTQNYVLVSSVAGAPNTIIGLNTIGDFNLVPEGKYFIYAVNIEGALPASLAVGSNWNNFVNTSADLCKEISVPYLNREVLVCGLNDLCSPDDIQVSTTGHNTTLTQTFILCTSNPESILAFNTTGTFDQSDYSADGVYTVYALNTSNASVLNSIAVGALFTNVRTISNAECADLSVPKAFDITNCGVILPIDDYKIDLHCDNQVINYTWNKINQDNLSHFIIDYSKDGLIWTELQRIYYKVNQTKYNINFDNNLYNAEYVKLTTIDHNGNQKQIQIDKLNCQNAKDYISIFPNPNNGNFKLEFFVENTKEDLMLKVYNQFGQVIMFTELVNSKGLNTKEIDATNFAKGIYYLIIQSEKTNFAPLKFVIN